MLPGRVQLFLAGCLLGRVRCYLHYLLTGKCLNYIIYVPKTLEMLTPILAIIPLHLFAYYMATLLGRDVDKPRNLAKSVTVE